MRVASVVRGKEEVGAEAERVGVGDVVAAGPLQGPHVHARRGGAPVVRVRNARRGSVQGARLVVPETRIDV